MAAGPEPVKGVFESDVDVVHRAGYICLPLLFDPSVAAEIEGDLRNGFVILVHGRHFVRTLSLQSLLGSYECLCPDAYRELRRSCLERIHGDPRPIETGVSERLRTILFQVMPHFFRRGKSFDRRKLTEEEILDVIGQRIGLVGSVENTAAPPFSASLRRTLAALESRRATVEPPAEGLLTATALSRWLAAALEARILEEERLRLAELLKAHERLDDDSRNRMSILQRVAEKGALELDGFGFRRLGQGDDYLIYKRIDAYALCDYYGRLYLFPRCRVAVSTATTLRPFVMETYKHPLLAGHDSGQEICLRDFRPRDGFSWAAVLEALQQGINALLYGYSSRRRNGYHSLERSSKRTGGPGVGETRPILDVDFADYRVPADDPRILSGEVEITNRVVP